VCPSLLQAAAQAVAAQAATGELASALKAAESRNAALTESLSELQEALERQRAAADLREEMLRQVGRELGFGSSALCGWSGSSAFCA
jgi:predicted  nucleic acid-binding Zn-ribbon protein